MFGHDDQSQHHDDANQAAPNGGLTTDDGQILSPPQTSVDDTAGDFIESELPDTQDTDAQTPAQTEGDVSVEPAVATSAPVSSHPNADHLLDIKQQALQQLTPLIGHLEQSAEEKFRTTMMMIQAADNDALIKDAYDAALQIQDEKVRAQALLDIVNEINYFTHSSTAPEA